MAGKRFDQWSRVLGSVRSRRTVVALALALEAGGLLSLTPGQAAKKKCKPKCSSCKKCVKGKCEPKTEGTPCPGGACNARGKCIGPKTCTPACDICKQCVDGACVNAPNGTDCYEDGIACTRDVCDDGLCTYQPVDSRCAANQRCDSQDGCQCKSNFTNCSGNPDDGCECETHPSAPDCCGNACHTVHENGLGQTFRDCVPLNTYDQPQAEKAAAAWAAAGHAGATTHVADASSVCPQVMGVVCHQPGSGGCACWAYSGAAAGRVNQTNSGTCTSIPCPSPSTPAWS
jgi:hypothetical protein